MAKMSVLEKIAKKAGAKVETIVHRPFGAVAMTWEEHREAWVGFLNRVVNHNKKVLRFMSASDDGNASTRLKNALSEAKGGQKPQPSLDVRDCIKWNISRGCFAVRLRKTTVTIPIGGCTHMVFDNATEPEEGLKECIALVETIAAAVDSGEMNDDIKEWLAKKEKKQEKAKASKKKRDKEYSR